LSGFQIMSLLLIKFNFILRFGCYCSLYLLHLVYPRGLLPHHLRKSLPLKNLASGTGEPWF
jgi:hypothetical protein